MKSRKAISAGKELSAIGSFEYAFERGKDATIFGYALVEHFKALWAANSLDSPMRSPGYKYVFARKRYTPDDKMVVAPNNDTI